jgi:hypothetical protein
MGEFCRKGEYREGGGGFTECCQGVACHCDAFELPVGWGVPAYAEEIASQD